MSRHKMFHFWYGFLIILFAYLFVKLIDYVAQDGAISWGELGALFLWGLFFSWLYQFLYYYYYRD